MSKNNLNATRVTYDNRGLAYFTESDPLKINIKTSDSSNTDKDFDDGMYHIKIKTDENKESSSSFDHADKEEFVSASEVFGQFFKSTENQSPAYDDSDGLTIKDVIATQAASSSRKESRKRKNEEKTAKFYGYAAAEDLAVEYIMENFTVGVYRNAPYIKLGDTFQWVNEDSIGVLIMRDMPKHIRKSISSSNFAAVANRLAYALKSQKMELHVPEAKVMFNNGVFNVLTGELVEAEDDELFLVKINANFYPEDKMPTPVFNQFLDTTCRGSKQIRKRLLEFLAYQLIPGAPAKAFFVLGTASNSGKSLIADFFKELLGQENVCAIPAPNFGARFSPNQLCSHVATFSMESDQESLSSITTRNIKLFTGGDAANFEVKRGKEWAQKNLCKIVFGTNHPIHTKIKDLPFYERMIVVPFLYSTPIHLRDEDLLEKLLAERDGIIKKLMKELKHLLINKFHFSLCLAAEQMRAEWSGCSHFSIQLFVKYACVLVSDSETKCATHILEAAFNRFCETYHLPKASSRKAFISYFYNAGLPHCRWTDHNGQSVRGPGGITLRPDFFIDVPVEPGYYTNLGGV